MPTMRPTMRQLKDAKSAKQRGEMELAIAEGRLTVRQMTPKERKQADRDRAGAQRVRAARPPGRSG
jgi:hypothetical protein